jgi:hypothetical protein
MEWNGELGMKESSLALDIGWAASSELMIPCYKSISFFDFKTELENQSMHVF